MDLLIIIILIVFVICIIYFIFAYNKIVKLNSLVEESFSTMDVYLQKRWDLIPNIVEVVKGCSKHEKNVFKEITELRNKKYSELSIDDKISANEMLNKNISNIMSIVEDYPNIKSGENYLDLQKSLTKIEDEIAQSRKYYNATVREYNIYINNIPSKFVANILGLNNKTMYEIPNKNRKSIGVDL